MRTGRWGQRCPFGLMDGETNQIGSGPLCGWCGATEAEEVKLWRGGAAVAECQTLWLGTKRALWIRIAHVYILAISSSCPRRPPDVTWMAPLVGVDRLFVTFGSALNMTFKWFSALASAHWCLPRFTALWLVPFWGPELHSVRCARDQSVTPNVHGTSFISYPDWGHRISNLLDQFSVGKLSHAGHILIIRRFRQACRSCHTLW